MERAELAMQRLLWRPSLRNILATGLIVAGVAFAAVASAQTFGAPIPPAPIGQPQQPQAQQPPPGGYPSGQPALSQNSNPVCVRLEAQLGAIDRGTGDPGRLAQIKRLDDAVVKQQADLDRMVAQSRRLGCQSNGFFSIFSNQPPQCTGLNNQIEQARGNLDRAMNDSQRMQSGGAGEQENQRQSVLIALSQNNCGPQYRAAAQPRGLFDNLFGGNSNYGGVDVSQGGTFRTLCVRTCDGYYYPISFATTPARFADDEAACKATCPASDVVLYSHRTNEDVRSATSISGRPYTELANAFRYRQQFDAACSCRKVGQSWADAMGALKDNTVERGDIVVTDEKSKALALPPKPAPARGQQGAAAPAQAPAANAAAPAAPATGAPIRSVGPTTNYPTR
jgi:hypothetical protein